MTNIGPAVRRQSTLLFWEFVVIVLGVLAAFAVDEWRSQQELEEQRAHVLESLLTDLNEDRIDYQHFVQNSKARAEAADYLSSIAAGTPGEISDQFSSPGEAMHFIGITALLRPTRSAIEEVSSTGARAAIPDDQLRARILQYYALANDRTAVNGFIEPEIQRYRAALENIGVSYSDAGSIDVETVLEDKTVQALIRSMRAVAVFAPLYCEDLIRLNADLISEIENTLLER